MVKLEPIAVSSLAAVGPFAVIERMATVELEPASVSSLVAILPFDVTE